MTQGKRCECGCGTAIPDLTKKGTPQRFAHGHNARGTEAGWLKEDRGHTTPCWIWQGGQSGSGYARARRDNRMVPLHRWHYEQEHGALRDGHEIDHLCRVPLCVNPDHLEAVTRAENVRRSSATPLTPADVQEIREARKQLMSGRCERVPAGARVAIAANYGVAVETIRNIWNGRTWA
jgi:hypothetical protein